MNKYLLQVHINSKALTCQFWHHNRLHWQESIHKNADLTQTQWPKPPRWQQHWWRWQLICDDSLCQRWRISCNQQLSDEDLYSYACMQVANQVNTKGDDHFIDVVKLPTQQHQTTLAWLVACQKQQLAWCYQPLVLQYGKPRAILLNSHNQCCHIIQALQLKNAVVIHYSRHQANVYLINQYNITDIFPASGKKSLSLALQQCRQWQRSQQHNNVWLITDNDDDQEECQDALHKHPQLNWWQLLPTRHDTQYN